MTNEAAEKILATVKEEKPIQVKKLVEKTLADKVLARIAEIRTDVVTREG